LLAICREPAVKPATSLCQPDRIFRPYCRYAADRKQACSYKGIAFFTGHHKFGSRTGIRCSILIFTHASPDTAHRDWDAHHVQTTRIGLSPAPPCRSQNTHSTRPTTTKTTTHCCLSNSTSTPNVIYTSQAHTHPHQKQPPKPGYTAPAIRRQRWHACCFEGVTGSIRPTTFALHATCTVPWHRG
jgi:hypothetical protein